MHWEKQATDEQQTNRQTERQHHRIKPLLLRAGLESVEVTERANVC